MTIKNKLVWKSINQLLENTTLLEIMSIGIEPIAFEICITEGEI
jgi:hypothetical protein